jgi:putative membrane protein
MSTLYEEIQAMKMKVLSWIPAVGLLVSCCWDNRYGPPGMGHMMHYGYWGPFMGLFFLILFGVIIYLVIRSTHNRDSAGVGETPLDIIKERYARGEITKDDYDRMKRDLSG